jgi:hypothetical protein
MKKYQNNECLIHLVCLLGLFSCNQQENDKPVVNDNPNKPVVMETTGDSDKKGKGNR